METLKIKFIKSHPGFAYFAGDSAELRADHVETLIASGHVILFPGVDKKEENPLPENLPCREILLANGFTTIDQIREAGASLNDIKGIGKKSFEDITVFLSANS